MNICLVQLVDYWFFQQPNNIIFQTLYLVKSLHPYPAPALSVELYDTHGGITMSNMN